MSPRPSPGALLRSAGLLFLSTAILHILPGARADAPAAAGGVGAPPTGKPQAPPEYGGAASPLESSEIDSLVRKAEELFSAQEWTRGLAALDEALGLITSPAPKRKATKEKKEKDDAPAGRGRMVSRRNLPTVEDPLADLTQAQTEPGEATLSEDGILFTPAATSIRRRLLKLPAPALDALHRTYESPARQAFERARALPTAIKLISEMRRAAARYPVTQAGAECLDELAQRLLGASRTLDAVRALDERLELPEAPGTASKAEALATSAVAEYLAGLPAEAARRLERVEREYPDAVVSVRGEAVAARDLKAHPFFEALRARAEPAEAERAAAPTAWPGPRGGFDNAALPVDAASLPSLGSQARWIYPPILGGEGEESQAGRARRLVASAGKIYYRDGSDVVALHASSGKLVWRASPGELSASGPGDSRAGYQPLETSGFESAESSAIILEPRTSAERPLIVGVHGPLRGGQTASGQIVYEENLLVALDALTGKLRWTCGKSRSEWDPTRGLAFVGPPASTGDMLVAPAARGDGYFAVGVSRQGKILWSRRLFTYSPDLERFGYSGGINFFGLAFAARDGVAVGASGHGLVCAVDAGTGALLWISRYRSQVRRGYFMSRPIPTPPIIAGTHAICSPADSDYVTAFDLRTGRIEWEWHAPEGELTTLLGADAERVYIGTDEVLALTITDGKPAWSAHLRPAAAGRPGGLGRPSPAENWERSAAQAIVTPGRLTVVSGDGTITRVDTADGSVMSAVTFADPRWKRKGMFQLICHDGQLLGASAARVFALEPQESSWKAASGDAPGSLGHKARLLRAEGRFEEALDVLDAYRRTLRRADLLDATARDVVATARAAAERTGKPEFITRVLARKDRVVKEREESLALRLLEAQLLEAAARKNPADAGPAVQAYLALSANDGILARAPDGFEVDVGTYACDALRELKAIGATVEDPRGNEAAAARAARLKTTRAQEREASFLLLRRPHLAAAVSAGRQLALAAQEDGDPVREAAVIALWSAADPAAASSPEVQERLRNLASLRAPRSSPRGIDELLRARAAAGGGLLEPSFWSTSEEGGILPLSAPESAPLPYVIALAGTKARVIGADGKTIAERVLPDYPDMSEMKTSLEAHIEEPVQVCLAGEMLALATPAGIFGFRGLGPGSDLTLHPKDLKLRWAKTWPHPLGDMRGSRGWGSMNLPTGQNFFPEYSFALANPLVLNREGNLFTVDWSSGKTAWRQPGPGSTPGSPPMMDDAAWIVTRIAHRPAFHRVRRPDPAGAVRRKGPPAVTVEATSDGGGTAADARLVPGALAMVSLSERGLEVYETASGRLLWKRSDGGAQIARVLATEIWLTEAGGRLVRRSLRSGRALGSVQIPQGAQVVDSFSEDTPAGGTSSWTVIASRNPLASGVAYYGGRVQTGTDLFVLKIEGDSKVWETRIHQGPVTYENGRYNTGDGKLLLLFNGEGDEAKWYTRGVLVGPTGELEPLLSVEIHGKGTGQPPRLQVLKDGWALGNADGFGWFVPRGVKGAPPPAGEGAPEKAEQDKSSKQPDAGAPGASREDPAK